MVYLTINIRLLILTVKCVTVAQVQQMQKPGGPPTSPGGSVMDLSTSSVTSTSPQVNIFLQIVKKYSFIKLQREFTNLMGYYKLANLFMFRPPHMDQIALVRSMEVVKQSEEVRRQQLVLTSPPVLKYQVLKGKPLTSVSIDCIGK